MISLNKGALVLFKGQPGRITELGPKKITVELSDEKTMRVRPKDVVLLHPGPTGDLSQLEMRKGDVLTAWELLAGERTTLAEIAELIYGFYTPDTAWSAYQLLAEGVYFTGDPEDIIVLTEEEREARKVKAAAKADRAQMWEEFINRLKDNRYEAVDEALLRDTELLALGKSDSSKALQALGIAGSSENAHELLLKIGYWGVAKNPYLIRNQLPVEVPHILLDRMADEERLDLTEMESLAIDDAGSNDPDDALSYSDGKLWVHIADAACLVPAGSPADLEARARGANLYLPDKTVGMLPAAATMQLGLGLNQISPALSFELDVGVDGEVGGIRIHRSQIRATRMTYQEADLLLEKPPLDALNHLSKLFEERRLRNGAIEIDLPEIKVKVVDGQVIAAPFKKNRSRIVVREAMLMVGEGLANYSIQEGLALPFTVQDTPQDPPERRDTLSDMFALRRSMKASRQSTAHGTHAGLGLNRYVQATSPLRRYLDLVVHQQVRAHLRGEPTLSEQELLERVGAAEAIRREVRWVERLSTEHWVLVYLMQNPDWRGQGVVVDHRGRQAVILIPDLGIETKIYQKKELELDTMVEIEVTDVNLAHLSTHFRLR